MSNPGTNIAREFRAGVEANAAAYLVDVLGTEQGKQAAARVAMAFAAAARAAKNPQALYDCSPASVMSAVAMCALTRLMPGGPNATVWLVPKGGELQWWLSHRGMIILAQRAGYQIMAIPVHGDDKIKVEFGEVVSHEQDPDAWPEGRDDLRGVYLTVRRLSDGANLGRPWLPKKAIDKRARKAMTQVVWNEWYVEQAQKTTIKWAMARGYVPCDSAELHMALEAEPQFIDTTAETITDRPTGKSALGLVAEPAAEPKAIAAPVNIEDTVLTDENLEKVPVGVTRELEPEPEQAAEAPGPDKPALATRCRELEKELGPEASAAVREQNDLPPYSKAVNGHWKLDDLQRYHPLLSAALDNGEQAAGGAFG